MDSPAFADMIATFDEWAWGAALVLSGMLQVIALWINGGQGWTPYMRAASHFTGFMVFFMGARGFWVVDPYTSGVFLWGAIGAAYLLAACGAVFQIEQRRLARHG